MKIGVTGSPNYLKKIKIKKFIWQLKEKFKDDLVIISFNKSYGTDKFVKKFTLDFDIKYEEFVPYHNRWNNFCVEQAFLFNKQYKPRYYHMINSKFIDYCDIIFIFSDKILKFENTLIKLAEKKDKKLLIFN